jgi:hypothetical protein
MLFASRKGYTRPLLLIGTSEGGLHFAQIIELAVLVLEVGTHHSYHQAYAGKASG